MFMVFRLISNIGLIIALDKMFLVSTAVTIGLQQSYYSTVEGQGPVDVCIMVLSGDITGMSYMISYSTTGGLAEGSCMYIKLVIILQCGLKQQSPT